MKWRNHTTRAIKVARLRIAAMILFVLAGVGFIVWPHITDYRYTLAQKALAAEASVQGASGDSQTGGEPMPDAAIARIVIPDIDLDAYVLEGTEPAQLDRGPGHYEETPLPGELGNVCIAGHRTMYGRPFNRLDELQPGDEVVLVTEAARHVYVVEGMSVVDPRDVSVVAPTDDHRLTLTTCHPERSARERLVVTALLDD